MHRIKILTNFSAAHRLRGYKGKCEALHGHNWKVEVVIAASKLDSLGMVIDFSELKKITNQVLKELDHQNLNDLDYFSAKGGSLSCRQAGASGRRDHNPSSEEIAKYIFDRLKSPVSKKKAKLSEVRIWETETSCAIYTESVR